MNIYFKAVDGRIYQYSNAGGIKDKEAFIRKWRATLNGELFKAYLLDSNMEPFEESEAYLHKQNIVLVFFMEDEK